MSDMMTQVNQIVGNGLSFLQSTVILAVTICIGLIIGLFGLKLARVWAALVGLVLGVAAGGHRFCCGRTEWNGFCGSYGRRRSDTGDSCMCILQSWYIFLCMAGNIQHGSIGYQSAGYTGDCCMWRVRIGSRDRYDEDV